MEGHMQSSSGLDLRQYCKKVEDEINSYLFSQANSFVFIKRVQRAIDDHLTDLVAVRDQTEQWLHYVDRPTKKEISVLAKKVIKYEDRLDRLDDTLHQILISSKQYHRRVEMLSAEVAKIKEDIKLTIR